MSVKSVNDQVRVATSAEATDLVPLYGWLFEPPGQRPRGWDPQRATRALTSAIESKRSVVLVAEVRGEPVGFCTAYLEMESVRFGLRCWVEDLAVHPQWRSQGIGRALLDAAKNWARDRGATHLELDSGEARTEAHRFYERENPSWRSVSYAWEL